MHDGNQPPDGDSNADSAAADRPAAANGSETSRSDSLDEKGGSEDRLSQQSGFVGVSRQVLRLSSAGLELAGYVLILGGIGYWVDSQFAYEIPVLGIVGVLLGFSLGMFRLIRLAQEVSEP